jgi:hypothetical protein
MLRVQLGIFAPPAYRGPRVFQLQKPHTLYRNMHFHMNSCPNNDITSDADLVHLTVSECYLFTVMDGITTKTIQSTASDFLFSEIPQG